MNHHAVSKMPVASEIIEPQLAVGGWTPIAEERERGLEQDVRRDQQRRVDDDRRDQVGKDVRNRIRVSEAPSERAASTNSFSRIDRTWPRMMRAM